MAAAKATAVKTPVAVVDLGSTSIHPGGMHGPATPAGTLHLVDGWEPLCGDARVRFVFPGRQAAGDNTCPACLNARLPRPRPSTRSRARAS